MKRIFDILAAVFALIVLSPVFILAAVGIKLTSRGPVLYKAQRAGKSGGAFTMYKFRTMHIEQETGASRITAAKDSRIFGWGNILRKLKIDELPQLLNVVTGDMSIVGPRPEDMSIVESAYTPWMMETLAVAPGMASPGSIYGSMYDYSRDAASEKVDDPEQDYLDNLLPMKLAIELVYVRNQTFSYDIRVIFRTVLMIIRVAAGQRQFANPPEYEAAREILRTALPSTT